MAANQQKMGPTGTAAGASHRLVSVPLIPHREHQRRRLLEEAADSPLLSSSSPVAVPNATWLFSPLERIESAASRPRRYPRRRRLSTLPNHPTIHGSNSLPHPNHPFRHLLDHHQQQQQTRQQQQQQVVSLYQGLGTHYADVWVGTPPQRQTLIVDTGSATTAFACSACSPKRCGRLDRYHTDPLFREGKSSSFAKIQCADCFLGGCHEALNECQLHVAYQEGSNWSAFEAEDRCYVGGLHTQAMKPLLLSVPKRNSTRSLATEPQTTTTIPPAVVATPSDGLDPYAAATDFSFQLRFGCQTQMTGPFRTQLADGIMGMDIGPTAIWNQMYLQNIIAARAFSLCFSRQANARRSGTQAGALTLGGTDVRLHAPGQAMVYSATNMDGAGFFSVKLHHVYLRLEDEEPTDASVSGSVVSALAPNSSAKLVALDVDEKKMNHGEIIIDSGTTDTYFVHHLSGPFKKAWLELVGTPYTNHPIAMSEEELNRLPTILLQFKGHSSNKDVLETVDNKQHLPLAATLDPNNPLDVLVAVPPSHYMEYQSAKGMYVPGIYFEEADGSVLGANVMMLHDILFDVEGFRIGWVESHCNYAKLVAPYMSLSKATTFVAATAKKISTTGSASFNSPKLRAHSGTLRDNVNSAGYCSSLKCRISIGSILFIWSFLTASMWVRKRRRVRTNRSGTTSQLQAMADIAATNSSFRLTTISDDESSAISVRGGKNFTRTSVLRSRSHLPTCVSDSDDDMQLPVRGKRRTREAVLRSRSSQNII